MWFLKILHCVYSRILSETISESTYLISLCFIHIRLTLLMTILFSFQIHSDFHIVRCATPASTQRRAVCNDIQSRACSLPHAAAHCPVSVPSVYVRTYDRMCCSSAHTYRYLLQLEITRGERERICAHNCVMSFNVVRARVTRVTDPFCSSNERLSRKRN